MIKDIQNRFKNKLFLVALAGIIYQVTILIGLEIPQEEFKTIVDLVSYIFIGFGVYASFEEKKPNETKEEDEEGESKP